MKKKILIVIPHLKLGGGAEKIAAELGNNLHKKGYDVTFLTVYDEQPIYDIEGKHFCLNENRRSNWPKKIFKGLNIPRKIARICSDMNIDTIISFIPHTNTSSVLSKILYQNRAKIILCIHSNPLKMSKKYNYLIKKLYPKADLVVSVSKSIDNILRSSFSLDNTKVIYNMHNINKYNALVKADLPDKDKYFINDFTFINVGNFRYEKAQWHLIRCFKKLSKEYPDVNLIILGASLPFNNTIEQKIKRLILKSNLKDKVHLMGRVQNVFPYFKNSDCYVSTSISEGLPNVLIEALSTNLPVISTDCVSGPREILCPNLEIDEHIEYPYHGKYGILTKPFETEYVFSTLDEIPLSKKEEQFANMMIKMVNDKKFREKYSNGLQRAEQFDVEKIIREWVNII